MDRSELERTTLQEALERYQEKEAQALKSKVSLNARIKIWLKHPLTFSARTILGKFDNGQHPP
ncbi:hypothetical protein [Eoetvoesiella caeni]|uniref:Uncharacterized protein n=1 Tax=Eoetvoesiella caeni TaxID=645616 RepID=A0A366HHR3_9BURK|nr:hypothetical protein [Eoetvoesiella caeni]MCI2808278.1 hypothetical protein [Eoetvoesiella caeni]NYT53719.1 hypothetical protein [Eoetvoesiella caeni]RBP42203.1 hypothetical protein DFR37_102589 [Eoetvoesiella caeni]